MNVKNLFKKIIKILLIVILKDQFIQYLIKTSDNKYIDGERISTSIIKIFNINDKAIIKEYVDYDKGSFSPNGKYIILMKNKTLEILS